MNIGIKLLLLVFGIQAVNAQVFQHDSTYTVAVHEFDNDKESSVSIASLMLQEHPEIVVSSFKVEAANRIERIQIKTLEQPELNDVDDVIRVDISYSQPYEYTISHYILMVNDMETILLPPLVNIHESNPYKETVYVFPNQLLGNVNKITKLEITYEKSYDIEQVNVLQNYAWNDTF